jgi:hypothetical protein
VEETGTYGMKTPTCRSLWQLYHIMLYERDSNSQLWLWYNIACALQGKTHTTVVSDVFVDWKITQPKFLIPSRFIPSHLVCPFQGRTWIFIVMAVNHQCWGERELIILLVLRELLAITFFQNFKLRLIQVTMKLTHC